MRIEENIEIKVGQLECKRCVSGIDANRYEVVHRPRPNVGGYVVLWIQVNKGSDEPDFVTVGKRPWTCRKNGEPDGEILDTWTFARMCADVLVKCAEED